MVEAAENGKESLHSTHANGMIMSVFNYTYLLKLYMPNSKYS